MNLFDHPAPELNQLRKRGGIPHVNHTRQPHFDAVLIRADGWSIGILSDQVDQVERHTQPGNGWVYVWKPGKKGGQVLDFVEFENRIKGQEGHQEQGNQEQEQEASKDESEAHTDEQRPGKRKKRYLRDKEKHD